MGQTPAKKEKKNVSLRRSVCLSMSQWWAKPNPVLGSICLDMTQFLGGANALKLYSVLNCPSVDICVSVWA